MCEQETPMKRLVASVFSGSAATTAKASPGIVVSSLSFAGISLEAWVTVLTVAYLLIMCFGALPRVFEACRFFWRLVKPRARPIYQVTQVESPDVAEKIKEAKDGQR